ncbi:helix-turn-helix domain-containing protein [Streptomyces sp. NPDC046197]|uniref:PucR family transcriptional regulator n=1 Tax=Streptomyces sp. NPDC046197 TaxID=3154337 RepID=UPI0033EC665F
MLADLKDTPGLRLECLVGGSDVAVADCVFVAERLLDLQNAPAKSVAVLGSHVCAAVDGYQFDIALRLAVARGVAALVLAEPNTPPLTSTSVETARRFGIAIFRQTEPVNLADLVTALDSGMRGSAELALRRAVEAFQQITAKALDPAAMVENAAKAASADIAVIAEPDGDLTFPVELDGEPDRWVVVRDASARSRPELLLVGRLLADTLALAADAARRAEELPIRSRAELLSEILDSSEQGRSELLRRARAMGLPIDGLHVVVRIEHDNAEELWREEVAGFEARQLLGRTVLDAVRSTGGTWHLAWTERSLLVIRMWRNDPGPSAGAQATKSANRALQEAMLRIPEAVLYCGVGTAHSGSLGLINSAAEARAAVAASRTRNRPNVATAFDNLGLRRTLVEWYASHTARKAIATVLAPLDRMGGGKAEEAIRTLQVYLDNHGSLSKTAASLHLHRNSVAYRIDRIFSELDVDPDNPDDWLLLQLACRARGLV